MRRRRRTTGDENQRAVAARPTSAGKSPGAAGESTRATSARRHCRRVFERVPALPILLLLILCATLQAAGNHHVRISIDTSISMRGTSTQPGNDTSGLALMATSIFFDLARYDLGPDGTFKVRSFDEKVGGPCPSTAPTRDSKPWLVFTRPDRDSFVNSIRAIPYDSPCTYFFPTLDAAAKDLEASPMTGGDKRIQVLITDGASDARADDARLLGGLATRMRDAGIELYILAFGKTAPDNERYFREIFRFGQSDGIAGNIFVDASSPPGDKLVDNMIEIFKASFSYTSDVVSTGSGLNLQGDVAPKHVAVLAVYQPPRTPGFRVEAPAGSSAGTGIKDPLLTGIGVEVRGAMPTGSGRPIAYGLQWVAPPAAGLYQFRGDAPKTLAVLRPPNYRVQLRAFGRSPADVAMVDTPMRIAALVSAADAPKPDPGEVVVQYRVFAVRNTERANGFEYYAPDGWVGHTGAGKPVDDGREYLIQPVFLKSEAFANKPATGRPYYDGYLEVRVLRHGNTVAELPSRHPIRIYPLLSLSPTPGSSTAVKGASQTLRAGDTGCTSFELTETAGKLNDNDYSFSAEVDPATLTGGLAHAQILIDGKGLNAWERGMRLGRSGVLGKHTVCVLVHKRTAGGAEMQVPVRFSLWQAEDDPYKNLDVVRPFTLVASAEAARWLDRWWATILTLFTLLLLAVLLWRLGALRLPPDLAVAVAEGQSAAHISTARLGEPNLFKQWFTRKPHHPVLSLARKRQLGAVVPLDDRLYSFRPAKGFSQVSRLERGQWKMLQPDADGTCAVAAHETYQVRGTDDSLHHFRLEYDPNALPGPRA